MKKLYLALLFSVIFLGLKAQISIQEADMPNPGDTIRLSSALATDVGMNIADGPNQTWDYANLTPISQEVTEFIDINQMPFTYQAVFNNPLNPDKRAEYGITDSLGINIPNLQISNPFTFYRKTSTEYGIIGFGVTISGFSIPGAYDNLDLFYEFPLNYGDSSNTNSVSGQTVPGLGYVERKVSRENKVDGWGTLTTPYGTFDVLRVKSEIIQRDSIKFDSLPAFPGITTNRTEIRFLGKGHGLPLLTIEQQAGFTISVQYIDSVRNLNTSVKESLAKDFTLFPNPVKNKLTMQWDADYDILTIYTISGQKVFEDSVSGEQKYELNTDKILSKGLYVVELKGRGLISHHKVIKK